MSGEDNHEPLDLEQIVYDFADSDEFRDELYDSCNFDVESADDGKGIVIEDAPNAEDFNDMLIDFANKYAKEVNGYYLKEGDEEAIIEIWEKEFDSIFENERESLIDKYRDNVLDAEPDYDDYGD